ncbi:oxamate carbamoyltransferase subunit AllH family protein [Vagococcus martis]
MKLLRTNDMDLIKQSMFRIIGLGIGLTPSGDDYLTGLILLLRLAKETDSTLKRQLELVLKEEDLPTNIISEQQLYFASFGRSKQQLIRLINNIGDDEQSINQFKNDVRLVQQIGSTSGFDLLLGISDGIKLLEEMR